MVSEGRSWLPNPRVNRTLTTVGYGDRSAHTDAEKLWVCCIELSGTLIFGVMAGTLTSIISEANDLSLRRDRELEDLQALLYILTPTPIPLLRPLSASLRIPARSSPILLSRLRPVSDGPSLDTCVLAVAQCFTGPRRRWVRSSGRRLY